MMLNNLLRVVEESVQHPSYYYTPPACSSLKTLDNEISPISLQLLTP